MTQVNVSIKNSLKSILSSLSLSYFSVNFWKGLGFKGCIVYHVQFVLLCMVKEIHKGMTKNIAKYSMRVFFKT